MSAETPAPPPETTPHRTGPLRIASFRPRAPGRELKLKAGDVLLGADGRDWRRLASIEGWLQERLEAKEAVLLAVLRGDRTFFLQVGQRLGAEFAALTPAETAEVEAALPLAFPDSLLARNWEIYAGRDGSAEALDTAPSFLAMILPPLWLFGRRFHEEAAITVLALATAFVAHWMVGAAAYAALCLLVGRHQTAIARAALQRAGLVRLAIVAAEDEAAAQAAARGLGHELKFRFGAAPGGAAGVMQPTK